MPKIVVTHSVAEIDTWLKGKAERGGAIAAMGGTNVTDYVAQDGSNTIAISTEVEDVDAMMATLASPPAEVLAMMEDHGVVPPLVVYVER